MEKAHGFLHSSIPLANSHAISIHNIDDRDGAGSWAGNNRAAAPLAADAAGRSTVAGIAVLNIAVAIVIDVACTATVAGVSAFGSVVAGCRRGGNLGENNRAITITDSHRTAAAATTAAADASGITIHIVANSHVGGG